MYWSNNANWFNPTSTLMSRIWSFVVWAPYRKKKNEVKKICLSEWIVLFFMAIPILPYSNIIYRRHKVFFLHKHLLKFFWIFFVELVDEAIMQILPKDWRVLKDRSFLIHIYIYIFHFFQYIFFHYIYI
jgi:hypothetical protein